MTPGAVRTNPTADASDRGLFVVHVRDRTNSALAGHDGREYASPPQPAADALALVALLLGCPAQVTDGGSSWGSAIAGGQRTITLAPAPTAGRTSDRDGEERLAT